MPVSLALKPAPEIVTDLPVTPLEGLVEEMLGVTVKFALPELEEVAPVAVMV